MSTARTAASPAPRRTAPASARPAIKAKTGPLTIQDYLQKILTSRVYDVAIEKIGRAHV